MKKNTLLAVAGLAVFAFLVTKIGWVDVVPNMKAIWMGLPVIVSLSFFRLVLQTTSWAIALRTEGVIASTGELIGIRLACQGTG